MASNDTKQVVTVICNGKSMSESKSPWKKMEKAEVTPILGEEDWPSVLDVLRPHNANVARICSQVAPEVQKSEQEDVGEDSSEKLGQVQKPEQEDDIGQVQKPKQEEDNGDSSERLQQVQKSEQRHGASFERTEQCHQQVHKPEQGGGRGYSSHKHEHCHPHRPKQNQNNEPRFRVPMTYSQPVVSWLPSSRPQIPFRPFAQPMQGIDDLGWRYQGPIGTMQISAPTSYMDPAFYWPTPLAIYPGLEPVYYPSPPPPVSVQRPFQHRFVPRAASHPVPVVTPEAILREKIAKQIEYYFSEKNLITDYYLIRQMDYNGWVPITTIAGFPRVKMLSTDINFILDALRTSQSVKVEGDKLRKRTNWSRYVITTGGNADGASCSTSATHGILKQTPKQATNQ